MLLKILFRHLPVSPLIWDIINAVKMPKGFNRFIHLAGDYLKDPEKRSSMLSAVKDYARTKKHFIQPFKNDLQTLILLLRDWSKGTYTEVPTHAILLVVAGLLYFLSPLDTIPDFLGFLGFTDDAAVVLFVLSTVKNEISRYREWRSEK
jgi:uncharacterized membrane protein YkvA (DUF1232 family)